MMATHTSQDEMNRRGFLKALVLTATAASTVGGGAAFLLNREKGAPTIATTSVVAPPPAQAAVSAPQTVARASNEMAEMLANLASAEAENLRLRTELAAAQRQVEALQTSTGDASTVNETLRTELAAANNRVSVLAGLVALYEELDDVDLGQALNEGLDDVGGLIAGLVDELPTLEEGVALGEQALDELEAQIPFMHEGRQWLETHLAHLLALYELAEHTLNEAVENAGSFLRKLNDWFQDILKWLPFGMGDSAAATMDALTNLLVETPNTIQGVRRNVSEPLDLWLAGEGDEIALRQKVIRPLKDQALTPATDVVGRVRQVHSRYEAELVEPVSIAVKGRREIRDRIAAYRKEHELSG